MFSLRSLGSCVLLGVALLLVSCSAKLPDEARIKKDLVGQELVYAFDNQDLFSMLNGGESCVFEEGQIESVSIYPERTVSDVKNGRLSYVVKLNARIENAYLMGMVNIEYRKFDQGWKIQELRATDRIEDYTSFDLRLNNHMEE